jgi:hypothetical protein
MSSKTNSSHMYAGQQHQYISSQDYFTEHYTAMLVQEAEKLYNKLVNEITKGITYDPAFSSSTSPSSSPLLSPLLSSSLSDGTTTKDIMQNHTFHGCEKTTQI